MIAQLPGASYVTRQSVHTPNAVRQLKKALIKSFQYQKENTRNLLRRGRVELPLGVEDDARAGQQVAGGEHVPAVSSGRHQGPEIIRNPNATMNRKCYDS